MENKKNYIIIGAIILILIFIALVFLEIIPLVNLKKISVIADKPKIVEETLVIPNTQKITGVEAKMASKVTEETIQTPLVPKNEMEKIIVPKAILTIKGSYDLAKTEVERWVNDAVPVFIKSLGAVTLDGKSSQWQLAFSSKSKQGKGYEVIIQGDQIVSKKEIDSAAVGAALPLNFKDSNLAIVTLQEAPRFSDATISAISLSYNTDGKMWFYALTTSNGLSSMKAQ